MTDDQFPADEAPTQPGCPSAKHHVACPNCGAYADAFIACTLCNGTRKVPPEIAQQFRWRNLPRGT